MKIKISDQYGNDVTYELEETELGHAFERMLPIEVPIERFGSVTQGFRIWQKLNTFGAKIAPKGWESICYYPPNNEFFLFYGGHDQYDDLYLVGKPIDGQGAVRSLSGIVKIEEIY